MTTNVCDCVHNSINIFVGQSSPIEFYLPKDPLKWTDPQSFCLHGKGKIAKRVGNEYQDIHNNASLTGIGPSNNFWSTCFESMVFKINDLEVGEISNNPYSSYIQTLLSMRESVEDTLLKARLFIKDTAGIMDVSSGGQQPVANSGWVERKDMFKNREWVDFQIPLNNDLMSSSTYFPPNTKITITLRRSSDAFCLMQDTSDDAQYRVELTGLYLTHTKYEVKKEITSQYNQQLRAKAIPHFDFCQNSIKTYTVLRVCIIYRVL